MSNSKSLTPGTTQKPKFTVIISSERYQRLINNTLGDPRDAKQFVASLTSAVTTNPALQECETNSIIAAAFLGAGLRLSPSPQLGQYYLVPFKQKEKKDKAGKIIQPEAMKAQFILGYKGMLQLAMRSGQLRKINAIEIKRGELKKYDPLNEEIQCTMIEDEIERENAETTGYYAFFELVNGFRKAIYWSKDKMMSHADKYSPAFSKEIYKKILAGKISDKDMWKYSSFWYKDFDDMARKTMLRQLISKGGCPMSIEMISAIEKDNATADFGDDDEIVMVPPAEAVVKNDNVLKVASKPEASEVVENVDLSEFEDE